MISAAIIAVCVVAMGVLYVVATNRKYERLLKEKKEKEVLRIHRTGSIHWYIHFLAKVEYKGTVQG